MVAESILSETVKFQKRFLLEAAMEKVEEHSKDNWRKKRTSTEERMLFWWHDSEYRFHFFQEESSQRTKEKKEGKEKHLRVVLEARIMLHLPWKENFTGRAAESMLKMVLEICPV